jgi:hypothetical protein
MEVNATPSMKVAHEEADTQALIQQQKWEFVHDTFQLLRIQQHMFGEVRGAGSIAGEGRWQHCCTWWHVSYIGSVRSAVKVKSIHFRKPNCRVGARKCVACQT